MTATSDNDKKEQLRCNSGLRSAPTPTPRPLETRKIRKPLMERKRRARINQSLDTIKELLLEANAVPADKEGNITAKLEKADILELTIAYIQSLPVLDPESRLQTSIPIPARQRLDEIDVESLKSVLCEQKSAAVLTLTPGSSDHDQVYRYRLIRRGIWRPW